MNRQLDDDPHQRNRPLILFVTGDAPRSRRAKRNLTTALEATCPGMTPFREINLLNEPQQAISFGIFATPALMHIDASGNRKVLYGDLSDERSLTDFLLTL